MNKVSRLVGISGFLLLGATAVDAAPYFDPVTQPLGYSASYVLSKPGLADGQTKLFRPSFNDQYWWGDLESFNVTANGDITDKNGTVIDGSTSYEPNWSAKDLLDARSASSRRIFTNISGTSAVPFETLSDLTADQQAALNDSQELLDYLRGDRTNEDGSTYRIRPTILGDIITSTPLYVEYDAGNLDNNVLFVGANDGMLHAFNAGTGEEIFAYIPNEVFPKLYKLADPAYPDGHQFYVNGELAYADVTFSNNSQHKILVGGLGGGGQAFFALDISNTNVASDAELTGKFLWEVSDSSSGMANLGYSYSRPVIAKLKIGTDTKWVVIVGNGYVNTDDDGVQGNGEASLFILDVETGALIKEISTGSGSTTSPNGLSSPTVVDVNYDGLADYVYAGDIDGHLWRFDIGSSSTSNWSVSFSGQPLATLEYTDPGTGATQLQPVTIPPRVLKHPDGGLLILVGTGRMLSADDVTNQDVESVYGLRDRLNGSPISTMDTDPSTGNILVQELVDGTYSLTGTAVRTSTAAFPSSTQDGWVVDLTAGERVVAPMAIRSGRLLFSSINPTSIDPNDLSHGGEVWVNEINALTGGAPFVTLYDMNGDGNLTTADNVDGNGDGDLDDPEDQITGLQQGYAILSSTPTTAILSSTRGTFFLNRQYHAQPVDIPDGGPGLAGGHFDVDTTSYISPIDTGSTDGHVHEYDDKYDVKGVDYFGLFEGQLHNINVDITDGSQKFKLIVVNADKSPGGRLVINQAYDENTPGTYTSVTTYDNNSSNIYSLNGVDDSIQLTQFGLYFDVNAILDKQLIPTQTSCVRSNTLSSDGRWRNGALTIWAVEVNPDGTDAFTLETDADGNITGITSGLLWESTLFWHWKGPCAHEYGSLDDLYLDKSGETVTNPNTGNPYTIFEYWRDQTILKEEEKKKKKKKRKHKKDEEGGDEGGDGGSGGDGTGGSSTTPPPADTAGVLDTISPPAWLTNPFRVSWSELNGG